MMSNNNNNKSLTNKSTSFLQQHKSSSMATSCSSSLPHSTATTTTPSSMVHRRRSNSSIIPPPQPLLRGDEEVVHFSHPQHPLSQIIIGDLFTCMGCKEFGAGNRFTCRQCDFQLHLFCAFAPPALNDHPLHVQHQLVFNSKPVKGGMMRSKCDICGKPCKGYNFQCTACGFQMHPCCAMLSTEINLSSSSVHPHTLILLPTTTAINITLGANNNNNNNGGGPGGGDPSPHDLFFFFCGECKRKRSGRVYRCPTCNYHIHAVCAKDMINGLHAYGLQGQEKQSMLGAAARLASQVVIDFIGGLIEGIGEGVGQVLIQDMVRGRCISRRRR